MKDHERATQVWAVLALAAHHRQILTYQILSRLIGVPARGLASILNHVQQYCMKKELPPLTSIVVSKLSGRPGKGLIASQDIPKDYISVFKYDWIKHGCPTSEDLETASKTIKK